MLFSCKEYTRVMTQYVLQVDNVSKRYDADFAVQNVSFGLKKGEVVGFVGLNGAGKSTTINMLMGFIRPTSGRVAVLGENIVPETAHKTHQNIGFAGGDMALFAHLTGEQYMNFLQTCYGLHDTTRARELCALFDPEMNKKIGDLSRGNKQKIALIAAFMHLPKVVILDEPSSGLDPLMQQTFLDLIRAETQKSTTILMSSHYLNEVADVCTRVLLIRSGRLVKDIPAHQLQSVNGKQVRVVSKNVIQPPTGAERITHEKIAGGHELSYVFKGSPSKLQQWLAMQPPVLDISIVEHDLESAFAELYEPEQSLGEVTRV